MSGLELYATQGFAMALVVYLLYRFEKKLDDLTKALVELKIAIRELIDR